MGLDNLIINIGAKEWQTDLLQQGLNKKTKQVKL